MRQVNAKLGKMRKAVDWVVYPTTNGGDADTIVIQSDKRIAYFSQTTGKGRLSPSCNYPIFGTAHMPGSEPIEVSPEFITECLNARARKGDTIGGGVVVIG